MKKDNRATLKISRDIHQELSDIAWVERVTLVDLIESALSDRIKQGASDKTALDRRKKSHEVTK